MNSLARTLVLLPFALVPCAFAQTPDAALSATLAQVAQQAEDLASELPSFTCEVSGVSQALHRGAVKESAAFAGTIRAQREAGRLQERTTLATVDGKPATPRNSPYFVHGGFADVLTYVTAARQQCSDFTQNGSRVDFQARTPLPAGCETVRGLRGSFTVDAGGNITHIERTLPESEGPDEIVPVASVDLMPVDLGGKTYRLASHMHAQIGDDDTLLRVDTNYMGCRLFKTEIKILPGSTVVDPAAPPAP